MTDEPYAEKTCCEQCPQVKVTSGVVLDTARVFLLSFCAFLLSCSNSLTSPCGEGHCEIVFEVFLRGSSVCVANGRFSMQGNLCYTMVLHSGNMSCPSELVFQ